MLTDFLLPREVVVERVLRETHDTFTLHLTPHPTPRTATPAGLPPEQPVPEQWPVRGKPGQFNMLYVFGVGEAPISVSGDPYETDAIVHTVRSVGGVSEALRRMRRGDVLGLRGPYGTCWPLDAVAGRDVVLIAGGIGLAALRPVVHTLLRERSGCRSVSLLYGARSPRDLLFPRQLEQWKRRNDFLVEIIVDSGDADWRGRVGTLVNLLHYVHFDPRNALVMLSAPEVMMRSVGRALEQRGVSRNSVWVQVERNMQCAVGLCGHCQLGPELVCLNGPIFSYDRVAHLLAVREL